jgi:hypothetical protein
VNADVFSSFVSLAVAGALILEPAAMPRVRSSHPYIRAMIEEAQVRSATFRALVGAIEATNGIVYVEEGNCGHGVSACLPLVVTPSGDYRILRVLVDARRQDWDVMSSIGHELQHAFEVLSQPGAQTGDRAFYEFYRAGKSVERFETEQALRVGQAVRNEIEAFLKNRSTRGVPR